jgi:hypothetical protein
MISMEMAVVLRLRKRAARASGAAIAYQAFSLAVHKIRLIIGKLKKPASSESATTASPETTLSPLPRSLGKRPPFPRFVTPPT